MGNSNLTLEEFEAVNAVLESPLTVSALDKIFHAEYLEHMGRLENEANDDEPSVLQMRAHAARAAVYRRMWTTIKERLKR